MNSNMIPIRTGEQIEEFAKMAEIVWNEHFTKIIGKAQVDYMLEKFQSVQAVTEQINNQGYEYFFIEINGEKVGYTGIHREEKKLFLSKLYILKEYRKKGYASVAFDFLKELCAKSQLSSIYLTVNKYNLDTIKVYEAKGFNTVSSQVADIGNGYVMDDYIMEYNII